MFRPRITADDWTLQINKTEVSDTGQYFCSLNTEPKLRNTLIHLYSFKFIYIQFCAFIFIFINLYSYVFRYIHIYFSIFIKSFIFIHRSPIFIYSLISIYIHLNSMTHSYHLYSSLCINLFISFIVHSCSFIHPYSCLLYTSPSPRD